MDRKLVDFKGYRPLRVKEMLLGGSALKNRPKIQAKSGKAKKNSDTPTLSKNPGNDKLPELFVKKEFQKVIFFAGYQAKEN